MGETSLFTVAGRLVGPLTASPQSLAFAGQTQGTTSPSQTITLENVGSSTVSLTQTSIAGADAASFEFDNTTSTCNTPGMVELAAGASCTLAVRFKPASTGSKSAFVEIVHSGLNSPLRVALSGTGTAVGTAPVFAVSPASLSFGSQVQGTASASQRLTVSNDGGTAPLEVATVTLAGADAGAFALAAQTCAGATVAPGASCTIDVVFQPQGAGAKSASIEIEANDSAGAHSMVVSGTGAAGVAAVSSETDANDAYPLWYQDKNGIRVEQCIDGGDAICVLPAAGEEPNFDPGQPTVFPSNFPSEYFYWVADSDLVATPGCGASPPGKAFVRMALEGAFANEDPVAGDQMVFGRIRVGVTSGLCPNTVYDFVHPYGTLTFETDADGAIPRSRATEDIGCVPVAPTLCNYAEALPSRVFDGFLRWNPAVAPAAPAGYLGDAITPHTVVGSPLGQNVFRIVQGSTVIAETDLFTVSGKIAGPVLGSPNQIVFAGQEFGPSALLRTVTLGNVGVEPVTINSVSLTGANPGEFQTVNDQCSGQQLGRDATCTIGLSFAPTQLGKQTAELTVGHTGIRSPYRLPLTGTGIDSTQAPAISATPTSIDFASQRVHTFSATQRVVVENTGTAPLAITAVALTGPAETDNDYLISRNGCADAVLDPTQSCAIDVRFGPTKAGVRDRTLSVNSNASGGPATVALTGTGTGGVAAAASQPNRFGYPRWYQDEDKQRLEPCLDAADAQCVLPAAGEEPGYDPGQPLTLPGNFPSEFFYYIAESDRLDTPGCPAAGIAPGRASVRTAVEGAFANGAANETEQVVFGRIRITVAGGLCPNTAYTFIHPYGVSELETNELGGLPRTAGTVDVGCLTAPCDFNQAVQSQVFSSFLHWPAGSGAPDGYLGDVAVPHTVVGSPLNQNYFRIVRSDQPDLVVAETSLFAISGKLAGPLSAEPNSLAYGEQLTGATSPAQTVTITNLSADPVTISSIATTLAAYVIEPATTCTTPAVLAPGEACTIAVSFAPQTGGLKSGLLQLSHDGGYNTPLSVQLTGTGVNPEPAVSLDTTSLGFGPVRIATTSSARTVTLTNTGTGALQVGAIALTGLDAGDFTKSADSCANQTIAPGASCQVSATFTPGATGSRSASLEIVSDAAGSPHAVALTGTGTAPVLSLDTTSLSFGTVIVGTTGAAQTVTVTNTGTANLQVTTVTIGGSNLGDFSKSADTCAGATVTPGSTCSVSIRFTPAATGSRTATLGITSDAAGSPHTVTLTGTGQALPSSTSITVSPVLVSFGTQRVNLTANKTITITNTGAQPLVFNPAIVLGAGPTSSITGTNANSFSITNTTCNTPIAPGRKCRIEVRFRPLTTGAKTATLTLSWNGGTTSVALSGTGR